MSAESKDHVKAETSAVSSASEEIMTRRRFPSLPILATTAAALVAAVLWASEKTAPALVVAPPGPGGASGLTLAPGLSFTDDSSSNFPIRGEDLKDGKIASDRPTAIFFGTSHCWNTNREAERFVALYSKEKENARFLVVDLDGPAANQKPLVSHFFKGYIPTLAFLDRSGAVVYNQSGETARERGDISKLEEILRKAKTP
jgi:hypothetical protein